MKHLGIAAIAVAAAAMVITACGSHRTAESGSASGETATFVLDEWSIVPPEGTLPAGDLKITATNDGDETHELVFVSVADAADLPKKADGSVDEDKIPESKKAGEIADVASGESKSTTLNLAAGDYVAFCNIVEDMAADPMGSGGMGSAGMSGDSGMTGTSMGPEGMNHVHFELGMVNYFTVA